jgi:uncharacterized Fe-S center protein
MKPKVYFIAVKDSKNIEDVNAKLKKLLQESKILRFISGETRVPVKIHFGEEGNTGFVNPKHVRVVCDEISSQGASPFLSDTNTLYRGRRTNAKDHTDLAHEHGFTKEEVGCDVVILDDTKKENNADVEINQKKIKTAKIARHFSDAHSLVAVSHFKGHMVTGFGGAIKNIGMGCATREGKLAQHNELSPVFYEDKCIGCGECANICPVTAIHIENEKAVLDSSLCIGCGNCVGVCPTMAMFIDFQAGDLVQEKMAEYASAVLTGKKDKTAFINFAIKINKECDCWGLENPRVAPDIGILASTDPVSIDKASLDLVNKKCGKDLFKEVHPEQNSSIQLNYASKIGLGSLDYELVEL